MFDEFLEEYKYNWKMADNQYTEERYRNSLSPKQVEKAQSSPTTSILLRIKWALKNLKMRIEAARFPEILAIAMIVFSISLILLIVSLGWNILTSETTLYRWSMTLYLVSGLLVLNLMPIYSIPTTQSKELGKLKTRPSPLLKSLEIVLPPSSILNFPAPI